MMKLRYSPSQRVTFECEVGNAKAAFEAIASIQEVFEEGECGCCKSKAVRFDVRDFNGNRYYKMACTACGAQFDFGQHKEGGGLFAKKWNKETRRALPNGGWYIFQGKQDKAATDQRRPQQANNYVGRNGEAPY